METCGVYGRAFCDFGDEFFVLDEDGETPKTTLLDRMSIDSRIDSQHVELNLHCVEGERHDVSKGDTIVIDYSASGNEEDEAAQRLECQVSQVRSPVRFSVRAAIPHHRDGLVDEVNRSPTKSFARLKTPRRMSFVSMNRALENLEGGGSDNLFAVCDLDKSFDTTRRSAITRSFACLEEFIVRHDRSPGKDREDMLLFHKLATEKEEEKENNLRAKEWSKTVQIFALVAKAKLTPVQAFVGAIGAQEVLKAATGLYNPIHQFLLYDCEELITHMERDALGDESQDTAIAPGQSYILGPQVSSRLASQNLFLVGSGAIGCEILKNLAAMGAATLGNSKLTLTDNDKIEKSNLSRQLLFREHNVGQFKSTAAVEATLNFNPCVKMDARTAKVGDNPDDAGGTVFDDSFWNTRADVVLNALDNLDARLYMDSKCVQHRKAMIDAGTLGPKGNVQVVIPNLTESYGSSVDGPAEDENIPVCTLKNFPYEISHTITWGRDLFEGLFTRRPKQANDNREAMSPTHGSQGHGSSVKSLANNLLQKLGQEGATQAAEEIVEDLEDNGLSASLLKEKSLLWAIALAYKLFNTSIIHLMKQHPPDSLDDDGKSFWTGTRRLPKIVSYSVNRNHIEETRTDNPVQQLMNEHLVYFVKTAARLRIEIYRPNSFGNDDHNDDQEEWSSDISQEEVVAALDRHWNDDHTQQSRKSQIISPTATTSNDDPVTQIISILKRNKPLNHPSDREQPPQLLHGAQFEKDEESNGHIAFITAASNLRALSYSIPPSSEIETRRIAGKIIPAMISTTALVSSLSCLELLKLTIAGLPKHNPPGKLHPAVHKNAFVNLAMPFFAFTSPLPPEERAGLNGKTYTLWDRVGIRERESDCLNGSGVTLGRFLKRVRKKVLRDLEGEVDTVSYGNYLIYANFLHADDRDILARPVLDLVREALSSVDEDDRDYDGDGLGVTSDDSTKGDDVDAVHELDGEDFLDFTVVVEEAESGEEIELPVVRSARHRQNITQQTHKQSP